MSPVLPRELLESVGHLPKWCLMESDFQRPASSAEGSFFKGRRGGTQASDCRAAALPSSVRQACWIANFVTPKTGSSSSASLPVMLGVTHGPSLFVPVPPASSCRALCCLAAVFCLSYPSAKWGRRSEYKLWVWLLWDTLVLKPLLAASTTSSWTVY